MGDAFMSINGKEITREDAKRIREELIAKHPESKISFEAIEKENSYKFQAFTFMTDFIKAMDEFLKIQPIYYDTSRMWWVWNHNKYSWEMKDEIDILNAIDQVTKYPSTNSKIKNELIEALRRRARLNKPHNKGVWLQFKDQVIDLDNDKEFTATSEHFVVNSIPWSLGKSEDTPTMDKIFEEWVGKDYVKTLYEIIAFCLLPSYPLNRLFCLFGEGLNGKSKFLELLAKFLGHHNVTSTELDTLLNSRFEMTRLHKKLACIMGETDFNEMKKTSILKKLTGGDLVGFEFKNKDLFHDINYAKIIISTNSIPPTSDRTIGFSRRWLIIDFPNRFSEKKDILGDIPEEEYNNLARKCIKILKELLITREFHMEGTIEERAIKYFNKSNPLEMFWKEKVVEDADSFIFKYEFKQILSDWCSDNRFRQITDTALSKFMRDKGVDTQKLMAEWYTKEGKRPRYNAWAGIKLKDVNHVKDVNPI